MSNHHHQTASGNRQSEHQTKGEMTEEAINYFKTIPLCASVLALPDIKILPLADHVVHDPFFRKAARTNNGVLRSLFLYRNGPGPAQEQTPRPEKSQGEGYLFLQIGEGITGQKGIAHGGFLATVMDEVSGTVISATTLDDGLGMFTAALNTTYQRPVFVSPGVPAVIVASSTVAKVEGRKVFVEAVIRDQEGNMCTSAESIFVKKRPAAV